jgi:hypothetical protein
VHVRNPITGLLQIALGVAVVAVPLVQAKFETIGSVSNSMSCDSIKYELVRPHAVGCVVGSPQLKQRAKSFQGLKVLALVQTKVSER